MGVRSAVMILSCSLSSSRIAPVPPPRACPRPLRPAGEGVAVTGEHFVEFGNGGARAFRVRPDRADHGKEIGAGFNQRAAILLSDAADGATRHNRRLAPVAQQFSNRSVLGGGLGCARKEGAKGDVVGAGFGGDDSTVA